MTPLTPEQQAFAEEHHGLILDFMEKHSLEDSLTYKQFEAIQFRNQGYTNREIADLCGVKRKAIEKRFARIRKTLSNLKEF